MNLSANTTTPDSQSSSAFRFAIVYLSISYISWWRNGRGWYCHPVGLVRNRGNYVAERGILFWNVDWLGLFDYHRRWLLVCWVDSRNGVHHL